MDMLDFEEGALYFDEPLQAEAKRCLDSAAEQYGKGSAEQLLMRAYFLEPEHPIVLVALYRYFYYQHRLEEALIVADRVLKVFASRLEISEDWNQLNEMEIGGGVLISMTMTRFYMLALKGAGFLELRLGLYESALARLKKVVELDSKDRLGARALIDVAQDALRNGTGPETAMHSQTTGEMR
ncbi:MAG: hypothetical protein ABW094_10895 [Candidatus Thiodiazotropha sp.]